jgi:peptide/nickel transport system ATP-binding protein/oligopeptide transport system ATP-binding protein
MNAMNASLPVRDAAIARADRSPVLSVNGLSVAFADAAGPRRVVDDLSYEIAAGETLGIVGESGSGKTITALALMGLLPEGATASGTLLFNGQNLGGLSQSAWNTIRGRDIAMVFQEPMTAMNPVMRVGLQIAEVLVCHEKLSWRQARKRAVELLAAVGIPAPERRSDDYPHQLSGGMRQRVMIAMGLACSPKLLFADEPTTALDVTIQAQILDLMLELQEREQMAIQFISHNLAVVSEISHRIMVMYAGRAVEYASADELFRQPLHPYTRGLMSTIPDPERRVARLPVIPGSIRRRPAMGCRFALRCPIAGDECKQAEPPCKEVRPGHFVACYKATA